MGDMLKTVLDRDVVTIED